jgi:hypothetical protein
MPFIGFELYSLILFPTLSIVGEADAVYPFTTTFQISNPYAWKNSLILMLQKA